MAATSQQHSLIYRVIGAASAANENRRVQRSLQNLSRGVAQFKAGLLGMRGMMMGFAASIVAVGLGLRKTITAYADYTQAQSRLRATLAASTNMQRQNAQLTSQVAERVAVDLGYSLTEANDAMTTMVQTGIGVHASMRLFGSSMRLARIAEMDTENATRFLVDTMNMFRGEMAEDNMTLREFADTMSGQLAVAANSASTNIEQLQQAFRYAGTEMSALGYRSHEVMSALAGLSVVGLRGTTAGTRLRGAVAALINPSQRVREQIAEVTGNTEAWSQIVHDEHGNLNRLPVMMSNLMGIMARLPTQQQRAQLEVAIFGRRALAAGISISEYNEAARRMLTINADIQDSESVRNRIMRMEEERMRSFGMQVQQLKEGLSDLAIGFGEILFGAMDTTREGFGTYIREIAQGIRLIGMMNDGNEEAQEDFNALSPRVQETARNVREFFIQASELLKTLFKLGTWLADFTVKHPYVVAGIIAIRVAFGGLVPALSAATRGTLALGRSMPMLHGGMAATTRGAGFLHGAVTLLAIQGIGMLTDRMQQNIISMAGMTSEFEQIKRTTVAAHAEMARGIPIVGNLVAQYVELIGTMQAAWREAMNVRERRRGTYERTVGATAGARVQERYERMRQRGVSEGKSEAQVLSEATTFMENIARRETAMFLQAWGVTGEEQVRARLQQEGITGDRLSELTASIVRVQESMSQEEATREAQRMAPEGLLGMTRDLQTGVDASVRQLAQFGPAIDRATSALYELQAAVPGEEQSVPVGNIMAEDAYVRRGGLMGVSSGDLIVSRDRLADAIFASRGEMAGPAVGAATSQMTGPTPSAATGGGELNITIPVVIDGREIARANGRANIRQLERGGGQLPPGQRRSLRETGFNRVI